MENTQLRIEREAVGITRKQAAEICNVSMRTYEKWERGEVCPTQKIEIAIEKIREFAASADGEKAEGSAELLKKARISSNLTQDQAAKNLGVSTRLYSDWERGKVETKCGWHIAIAEIRGLGHEAKSVSKSTDRKKDAGFRCYYTPDNKRYCGGEIEVLGTGGGISIEGRCCFCGAEYEDLDAGRSRARQVGTRYGDGFKVTAELLSGPNAQKAGRNSRAGKWLYAVEETKKREEEKKRVESAAADNQGATAVEYNQKYASAKETSKPVETKDDDGVLSESAVSTPAVKSESKKKPTFGWKETQNSGKAKKKAVTRTVKSTEISVQNEDNTMLVETDGVLSDSAAQDSITELPDKSISNNTETEYSNHESQEVEICVKNTLGEQVVDENLTGLNGAYNTLDGHMELNQIFGLDNADDVLSDSEADTAETPEQQDSDADLRADHDSNPENMSDGTDAGGILSGSEATEDSNSNGTDNADGDGSVAHNSNPDSIAATQAEQSANYHASTDSDGAVFEGQMTIDEIISNMDGVLSDSTLEDDNTEVILSDAQQLDLNAGSKSATDESGLDCEDESTKASWDEVLSEGSSEVGNKEVLLSYTQQPDLNTGSKSATNESGSNCAEDNSTGADGVLSDAPQTGQDTGSDADELLSGIPQTHQTAGSKSEDTHAKANVSNPNNRAWFTDSIGSKSDDCYFVGEEINEADGIVQLREPVLSVRSDEKPFDLYNPRTFWKDTPDANGFTLASIMKLLDEEEVRLTGAKFVLGGINFMSGYSTEADAIKGIRDKSVLALKSAGKTYTQNRIDKKRALDAKSEAREKAASEAAYSKDAKQLLSWQYSTGVLSDAQFKELCEAEIIPPALIESTVPTVAEIYEKLDRSHMADGIAGKSKTSYSVETVARYDDFWNQINSDICHGEFGRCSYWIAAGGNWLVGEYIAATIKTAFAAGLTVVPAVSLTELRSIFDKSHNYLNDLELHCSVPRAMRDSIEQFALFNEAYTAIYEGAASSFSPNSNRLKKQYHWRSYMLSDLVIITLPAYGVLTGGLEALGELLLYRGEVGKSTVIVSHRSLRDIQELNSGLLSDFFNRTSISVVKREDACMQRGCGVNDFVYFSVHGDASERGGDAQLGKKIAEAKATIAKMANSTTSSNRSTRNKKPSKTVGSSTVARKKANAEKGAPE